MHKTEQNLIDDRLYTLLALAAQPEGDATFYDQLRQVAPPNVEWPRLIQLAERHRLAPLLYYHWQAAGVTLPPDQKRVFQSLTVRHREANRLRAAALAEILDLYRAAGIPALVLKGAALAHLIYPRPGLRPMSDLDLLVKASDARQAQRLLAEAGFTAPPPRWPDRLPSKHLLAAARPTGGMTISVEVHHNLFHDDYPLSLPLEALWPAARSFTLPGGQPAYTLGREDMLWHLAHHIVNIAYPFRLIWQADIVGFAAHYAPEIDWPRLRRTRPRILNLLALFQGMTPLPAPLRGYAGLQPEPPPAGLGREFSGWPRFSLAEQREKSYPQILRDTFWPSEWWLRLYYGADRGLGLAWTRAVRHPLHILGLVRQMLLEHTEQFQI